MELPIDAVLGERIRYYRKQAGLTQKGLADLCEISESAIRNYELGNRVPDFLTLHTIAEQLRVSYYALADVKLTELDGALRALYQLEEIYGLYPTVVDGHIHFAFRDSIAMDEFRGNDLDDIFRNPCRLLQYRVLGFLKASGLHSAGKLTDEEYALWKSKFPAFLEDFHKFRQQEKSETFDGDAPAPVSEPQVPKRKRKRKVNNGR